MEDLYRRYRDYVAFFVVYVQEAHPTDGWQTDSNVAEGILFRQHQSTRNGSLWPRRAAWTCTCLSPCSSKRWTMPWMTPMVRPRNGCTSSGSMGAWRTRGVLDHLRVLMHMNYNS